MESEKAGKWLQQFFADVGLRWWPYMARRSSRMAGLFPRTVAAFKGLEGGDAELAEAAASDDNDSFWSGQVRSVRSISGTKTGVPELVLRLPSDELAPFGEESPRLADTGRLLLGRLFRELQRGSRPMVEKFERIADLDEGWLDGLGQLFGYLVMAKYLNIDRERTTGSVQVELTSRWQHALRSAALLQSEERSRESAGREVNDRLHHLLRNGEVQGKLASMIDNRDEVLVRRFLETHGYLGMSFDGKAPGSQMTAAATQEICVRLGLPAWSEFFDVIRGVNGDLLVANAHAESAFATALSTTSVRLPSGARGFFLLSRRYLSNRNRAMYLYKELRRSKVSLGEFDAGETDDDAAFELDAADNDLDTEDMAEASFTAGRDSDHLGSPSVTYEASHQVQVLMALRRLELPDLQLLWCLARCRVAWTPNTGDSSSVERDWVYAAASNAMRALLELDAQDSTEMRMLLSRECERLQKGHAAFHVAGDRSKLFIETIESAFAWFRSRGVQASAFSEFELELNNAGGYRLTARSRRDVARWRHTLVQRCRADWPAKLYLLPAIAEESD